jgi:hypothetical protein
MKVNLFFVPATSLLLKGPLAGPLELTRRTKALVWDDELELDEDTIAKIIHDFPPSASPQPSISTLPLPGQPPTKRSRRRSSSSDFPPPIRRISSDYTGSLRPVPFSAKFQRVHPGTTGVTVLEHMERLDAVEASLERLGIENVPEEEIEEDVGESSSSAPRPIAVANGSLSLAEGALIASSSAPPRGGAPELTPVPEADSPAPSVLTEEHEEEEDVAALSKSLSHIDTRPLSASAQHRRGVGSHSAQATQRMLDWMQDEPAKKRTVISEVGVSFSSPTCVFDSCCFIPLTPATRDGYQKATLTVLVIDKSGLGVVLLAFELGVHRHVVLLFGFGPVQCAHHDEDMPLPYLVYFHHWRRAAYTIITCT